MPLWNSRNNNNNGNGNPNSGDPYAPPPPKDYGDDDDDGSDDDKLDLHSILAPYTPLLQKLSLSSFLGYCSAITAKKLGQRLAFSIGLGFMICQGLVYKGIVHVDWKQVEKSVAHVVDTVREKLVAYYLFITSCRHLTSIMMCYPHSYKRDMYPHRLLKHIFIIITTPHDHNMHIISGQ